MYHAEMMNGAPGEAAEYVIVQFAGPGRPVTDIGILLLDPSSDRLYFRFRDNWASIADADDVEVLSLLAADLARKAREMGGRELLEWLEDTLSNALQLTERRRVHVTDFDSCLADLFERTIGLTEHPKSK